MPLPIRFLGTLDVGAIGFGAMVLSPGMYGDIDDARAEAALSAALDHGATMIDTSDAYGDSGHNERLVGRAIRHRRDTVTVATKFGLRVPDGAPTRRFPVNLDFGELSVNADPAYIRGYAEQSLRELNTDRIDLYYQHFPDPGVPIEDSVGATAELIDDGLVRHLGLSNVTAEQLRAAHAVHPVTAVQYEWSMWQPVPTDLHRTATELGIGIVAWSPLGSGFLTGTVQQVSSDDFRRNLPRFKAGNLAANHDRFAPIRSIADTLGITAGQLALGWLLAQDDHVVPIPGSRNPDHIRENLDAALIELHPDTVAKIDEALGATEVEGASTV